MTFFLQQQQQKYKDCGIYQVGSSLGMHSLEKVLVGSLVQSLYVIYKQCNYHPYKREIIKILSVKAEFYQEVLVVWN